PAAPLMVLLMTVVTVVSSTAGTAMRATTATSATATPAAISFLTAVPSDHFWLLYFRRTCRPPSTSSAENVVPFSAAQTRSSCRSSTGIQKEVLTVFSAGAAGAAWPSSPRSFRRTCWPPSTSSAETVVPFSAGQTRSSCRSCAGTQKDVLAFVSAGRGSTSRKVSATRRGLEEGPYGLLIGSPPAAR